MYRNLYVKNNNNPYLKDIYEILIDEEKTKMFENEFNDAIKDMTTQDKYNDISKQKSLKGWLVANKYFKLHPLLMEWIL